MLKKLLKYDLKWIYKLLIIFYILALIFSVTGRLLVEKENSFILNIVRTNMPGCCMCYDDKRTNK